MNLFHSEVGGRNVLMPFLLHLATLRPSFFADVSRGQMFIAIIEQPLLSSRVLSVPFSLFRLSFHLVPGWGDLVQPAASAAL